MSSKKVTIRGRVYDLDDIADLKSIQAVLVPENWDAAPADCVRALLSYQNMLALQLKRHLAANWRMIAKTAMEERGEEGGTAQISIGFGFTLDLSAPTVATIVSHKLGFSVKHETKGKAQTHDINQGEFIDEDMNVVLDVKGFEKENATPEEKDDDNVVPMAMGQDSEGDVTPETAPGDTPPPAKKRGRKKS